MDKNKLLKRIAVFTGVSLTAMHVFNRISTYIATADNLLGAMIQNILIYLFHLLCFDCRNMRK